MAFRRSRLAVTIFYLWSSQNKNIMKTTFLSIILAALVPGLVLSQPFPYTLTSYNEAYVPINESTTIEPGIPWDDPNWIVPIGFTFTYMDETFTEIIISAPGSQVFPMINEQQIAVLIPYFADLQNASAVEFVSPVRYVTEGEPGFRIFKLEWSNAGFYFEGAELGTFNNTINFQVWFYESTNDFDIRFGPNSIKNSDVIHFFGQPAVLLGKNVELTGESWEALWSLAGDPSNPEVLLLTSLGEMGPSPDQILSGEPADGQVYHFDTGIVGVEQAQAQEAGLTAWPTVAAESIMMRHTGTEPIAAEVLDLSGRVVASWTVAAASSRYDITALPAGHYVVRTAGFAPVRFIKTN